MQKAIAVVIPAWDLADELEQAVESVTTQGPPVRVIIVDNASQAPLPLMPNTEVIRLAQRVSVGRARNVGLAHVHEELVMFMEGDDVLLPGTLAFLHAAIGARPDVAIVAGRFAVWNPQTDEQVVANWPFEYCYRLSRLPRLFSLVNIFRNVMPTTGPVLMRARAARAAGGFGDSDWAEDWALGAVLTFIGSPLLKRRLCGLYRVDPRRTSLSDIKEGRIRPAWNGRRDVRRKLRSNPNVPRYIRWATPLLVPVHAFFTLQDLRTARQQA